jgi:hypothetical protein
MDAMDFIERRHHAGEAAAQFPWASLPTAIDAGVT